MDGVKAEADEKEKSLDAGLFSSFLEGLSFSLCWCGNNFLQQHEKAN